MNDCIVGKEYNELSTAKKEDTDLAPTYINCSGIVAVGILRTEAG